MKLPKPITSEVWPCPACSVDLRGNCSLHISTAHGVQYLIECMSCGDYRSYEAHMDEVDQKAD